MSRKTMAEGLAAFTNDQDLRQAKARLGLAMPDEGWLSDYLRAVTPLTDAPTEFHLVSGLCALSAAVGTRLYTREWGQNVFPHLWAVLVAPSSFWRKSTAIGQAEQILRSAAALQLYPSEWSKEKFLSLLAERPTGLLTAKEFGGFLSLLGREYNAGSKEMLTDLYDGPEHYTRSLQKKEIEVRRPALTILGATTLDWLEDKITDGDLRGGFLARFLWITAKEKGAPKGLTGDMDAILRNRLVDALNDIHFNRPERTESIVITPEARERYDEWMLGWEAEVMATSHRSDLSGFAVRLQTYALKLAMLYRVSATAYEDEPEDWRLGVDDVDRAIAYVRILWASVSSLIDERIATDKDAKLLRRILGIVGAGCTRSQALKLSKIRTRDFQQLIDTLIQSGQLYSARVRASEVGLERERDKLLEWLSPHPVHANGHDAEGDDEDLWVPSIASPDPGEPESFGYPSSSLGVHGNANSVPSSPVDGELQGDESLSESPFSSTSLSSLSSDESGRAGALMDTRMREGKSKPDIDRIITRGSQPQRLKVLVELAGGKATKEEISEVLIADGAHAALSFVESRLAARDHDDGVVL